MGGRKLVVLSGRTKGTEFVLTKPQVNAGREDDNAICLKGKRVSRYHAVLVRNNGEYTLRDMSPRIGTLLNGQPAKEAHLKVGDRICIGEFEMSYEAAPAIDTPSATMPPQPEEIAAPGLPVKAAAKESVDDLAVATMAAEHQRRMAEVTQVTERLVGEVTLANEITESLRAQLQRQLDLETDLTARLGTVSRENAALAKLNGELRAKISELEASVGEVARVEGELVIAQAALREMSEALAEARESTKLEAVAEPVETAVPLKPAESMEELLKMQTAPAEGRDGGDKTSDLSVQMGQFADDDHELRMAEAKTREEAVLAKRGVFEQTNEQFDRIRRSMVAKQDQKPVKTNAMRDLFMKFLRA